MKWGLFRTITVLYLLCVAATLISMTAASDPSPELSVPDRENNRVPHRDGATGSLIDVSIQSEGGGLAESQHIAVGPDGNLYVTGVWRFWGQRAKKET